MWNEGTFGLLEVTKLSSEAAELFYGSTSYSWEFQEARDLLFA